MQDCYSAITGNGRDHFFTRLDHFDQNEPEDDLVIIRPSIRLPKAAFKKLQKEAKATRQPVQDYLSVMIMDRYEG